jgi:hypothetical protein
MSPIQLPNFSIAGDVKIIPPQSYLVYHTIWVLQFSTIHDL